MDIPGERELIDVDRAAFLPKVIADGRQIASGDDTRGDIVGDFN